MALAHQDPEKTKQDAADQDRTDAENARVHARQGSRGQPEPSERQGEGIHDYGRQGGSVADTGTRTDDPVGAEQIESSAAGGQDPQRAKERQQSPPSPSADRAR